MDDKYRKLFWILIEIYIFEFVVFDKLLKILKQMYDLLNYKLPTLKCGSVVVVFGNTMYLSQRSPFYFNDTHLSSIGSDETCHVHRLQK